MQIVAWHGAVYSSCIHLLVVFFRFPSSRKLNETNRINQLGSCIGSLRAFVGRGNGWNHVLCMCVCELWLHFIDIMVLRNLLKKKTIDFHVIKIIHIRSTTEALATDYKYRDKDTIIKYEDV